MITFMYIILGCLGLFALVLAALAVHARTAGKRFVPMQTVSGPVCVQGDMECTEIEQPRFGPKVDFPYTMRLHCADGLLAGGHAGREERAGARGDIFLSLQDGRIEGRTADLRGMMVVEGVLTETGADVTLGFPKTSALRFLNSRFGFTVKDGEVQLSSSKKTHGCFEPTGSLAVEDGRVRGALRHMKGGYQLNVEVDMNTALVNADGIPEPLALLAVLLTANSTLGHHRG